MRRVCLVSSGTGGHLLPAVVLAQAFQEAGDEPLLCTAGRPVEAALLGRLGVPASAATSLPESATGPAPWRVAKAIGAARRMLRERDVDLVVSTGGRTSFAVGIAARSLRLPLCLLEQNAVPGRANRILAHLAKRTWLGLPIARRLPRTLLTGTPLRREIGSVTREQARHDLALDLQTPVVLVTGGSQGARALNEIVPDALCRTTTPLQVLHLSGAGAEVDVRRRYATTERVRANVRPMSADMATLYAAADLVICRGGGGTVAELAGAGRGAIVIPYPHHRDRQQFHNGGVLADVGAAVLIEQHALDVDALATTVQRLLLDGEAARMGERATRLAHPDACERILEDLSRLVRRN
jgi:UDP-N-acetylglucosamine--N-acetylmuramyl-(pentapeptide) pyrophosphoryl-undecaprenol N-acetylglucosamine transferase